MSRSVRPFQSLKEKLIYQIKRDGPIPLATYMQRCLHDPQLGYYTRKTAIGSKGDFITAPEVSQMFGELIGIWCISNWQAMGSPSRLCLVEAGPGLGTLISDCLRAIASQPEMLEALELIMVEASAKMRATQKEKLTPFMGEIASVNWRQNIDSLPDLPTLFIANEFLDALPVRQFTKTSKVWHEVGVGIENRDRLKRVLLPNFVDPAILPDNAGLEADGATFEYAPARQAVVEAVAGHIDHHCGAALFIDYGHSKSGFGDTFQAMGNHTCCDPFEDPGTHDVTSHVDFDRLMSAAKAHENVRQDLSTQADFLLGLGLLERAGALGYGKSLQIQNDIHQAVERLAGPEQMGGLFKVLELRKAIKQD